ncbi:hypothetical protein [Streptomyces sp. NPDC050504]|uniref:hypothetical protein n=1 Tax=Streptomyces sp. NPDC050504 TaxID=3365618 RepID=UPI0037A70F2C
MAVINPPAWQQAGSYPARNDRLALSGLLGYPGNAADEATPLRVRPGVKPSYQGYQMKVRAAGTPNMTVLVSGGTVFIDQRETGGSGAYICANDGDVTLTVQPAGGAGQYRKDTVVASVYDAEYSGVVSEWRLEVIQGPYAASAGATVRGTLPANSVPLADLAIAPSQTSVATGNITDVRVYGVAIGGVLPVASSAVPARLHPGQVAYLTDVDRFVYGDAASATKDLVQRDWVSYAVAWSSSGTAPAVGNGMLRGVYCQIGKTVHVRINLLMGITTTYGTGTWRFTVPVTADALESSAFYQVGSAMMIDESANALYPGTAFITASTGFIGVSTATGGSNVAAGAISTSTPFTWASTDSVHIQITYEVA